VCKPPDNTALSLNSDCLYEVFLDRNCSKLLHPFMAWGLSPGPTFQITMSAFLEERVLSVHHWTDRLFSFTTTRDVALRFSNGHFTMIGLRQESGKPLLRAYSIASANYEEHLEFLSIKVPDGPLTSKLQHIQVGDTIVVGRKPTGTLLCDYLLPGKNLYLMSTGTGLAPFMSIIRDPETYERFEKVILVHGVRQVNELAYHDYITQELPAHEFLGEMVSKQLLYYPTVTREPYQNQGRVTDLIENGKLFADLGLSKLDPETDRVMICGSPAMLKDLKRICEEHGLKEGNTSTQGAFVIERAFADA
jgi:ferredoxin/flavodoxin---NADP+ reductase